MEINYSLIIINNADLKLMMITKFLIILMIYNFEIFTLLWVSFLLKVTLNRNTYL